MTNNLKFQDDNTLDQLLLDGLAPITPTCPQQDRLRKQMLGRVANSLAQHAGLLTIRLKQGAWQSLKSGIRFKPLWTGTEGSSVLIEFAAGASLPPHRHLWLEEGIVLQGDLQMGELTLSPLDYHASPVGSRHTSIHSKQGALAFLRGTSLGDNASVLRELVGGLLPSKSATPLTVFNNTDETWDEIAEGVYKKDLWQDEFRVSRLCRFEPGAKFSSHSHFLEEECMMLEGEVFLGDILLRTGEYQLAPAGSVHGEVYSDVGGVLFVRGARDY